MKQYLVLACAAFFTAPAFSAESLYGGVSLANIKYKERGIEEATVKTLVGRFGARFSDHLSGEIRLGSGMSEDTVQYEGVDVDLEVDRLFGAYFRAGFRPEETIHPYVMVGFTNVELTASASAYGYSDSESDSDTDISIGFGTDIHIGPTFILNLEYTWYYMGGSESEKSDYGADISGLSIGFAGQF